MKMGLEEAIKATKNYALKYGQKLNGPQLFERLISPQVFSKKEIVGQFKKKSINNQCGDHNWQEKVRRAQRLTQEHLSKMKGILMVGVTGSVATEWAKKSSDIDLLIVTQSHQLWWWRLYLRIYVWWHQIPHRKFRKKEKANEFCFNLWLSENNLKIPTDKENLKNATDLIMMKVILNKENTYEKFLRENAWVKKFLATGYDFKIKSNPLKAHLDEKKSHVWVKMVNLLLFTSQYVYMCLRSQKLVKNVNLTQAFFHNEN